MSATAGKAASRSTRVVEDDEDLDMDLLLERFHEGAVWYGLDEMNIGWPEELHIGGKNLIRLLTRLRDEAYEDLRGVKEILDRHRIPSPEGLTQTDRLNLLIGRKAR